MQPILFLHLFEPVATPMHRHDLHIQFLESARFKNRGKDVLYNLGEGRKIVYKYYQII